MAGRTLRGAGEVHSCGLFQWVIGRKIPCERKAFKKKKVAQSCPTLCDPVDCSLPVSSVHGILQERILEWVAIPFSRGSSRSRDRTGVSLIEGRRFALWVISKPPRCGCAWASRLGLGELRWETAAPLGSPAPRRPAPRGRRCFGAVAESPSTAAVWQPLSRLFILERWVGTGENQGELLWGPLCVAWRHVCFPKSLVWRSFGNVSALLPCHSL